MTVSFLGKILGFFLGYLVLGPVGAIIGVFIGAAFDRGLNMHLHQIPRSHSAEVESAFFKATFSIMGHLAKVDGNISPSEIRAAESIMQRLELNEELRKQAIRLFSEGKSPNFNLAATLKDLYRHCQRHPDLLRFFIEIQLEAALADSNLTAAEHHLLLYMCEQLKIPPMEFEQLFSRQWASQSFYHWFNDFNAGTGNTNYGPGHGGYNANQYSRSRAHSHTYAARPDTFSMKDAYGVLGVVEQDSPTEIKKAYRRLMNQHHPDKLASRGLPESMIKLAKEKTQQIRAAYDLIREARGFR